jgi:NitT/TauT family transport system substrate-binding protein
VNHRQIAPVLLMAASLLLAGCGGGAAPPSSAAAPASTAPAGKPAASAAASPAAGSVAASAKQAEAGSASAKPAGSGNASTKPAGSGSSAASAAAGGSLTKITASWSALIPAVLPVWVALEGGYYKQNGLDVDLQYIESSKGIPAMVSGQVQVSDVGGSETMAAVAGGADLITIGGNAPVWPFILQVPASIKTAEDLKGKKVGVSNFGSSSDIATRVALRHLKLEPDKDVAVIAVGSASNRIAALQSGAIQAGVSYPPESLRLEADGFHTLEDLAAEKLPGNTASTVVPRAFLNSNRAIVQKYEDSIVMAIARLKKDKAFTVNVLKKYFKSDDTHAMEVAYDYFAKSVIPSLPYPTPEQYADAKEVLGVKNDAVKNFDVTKMLERSFVDSAAQRGLDKG